MKQSLAIALLLTGAFLGIDTLFGDRIALAASLSAMVIVAALNALTFFWLWYVRATPLALGMALSWAGQAGLTAWWEIRTAPDFAEFGDAGVVIYALIALYVIGGALHISVMQTSMDVRHHGLLWVAVGAGGTLMAASLLA